MAKSIEWDQRGKDKVFSDAMTRAWRKVVQARTELESEVTYLGKGQRKMKFPIEADKYDEGVQAGWARVVHIMGYFWFAILLVTVIPFYLLVTLPLYLLGRKVHEHD